MLTAAGVEYAEPWEYAFDDKSPYDCVSGTLETAAYTGAIQYISNDAYSTTAASIITIAARHASWINLADPSHRRPSLQHRLQLHQYPQLSLTPELIPRHETLFSFSLENEQLEEQLYVAFLSGAATIFALISKNEGNYVVETPEYLRAAGTVVVVVFKGEKNISEARLDDVSMIAGPAILVFPFDSRRKYPSYSKGEKKKHGSH
ncbi:hypothetical protein BYT27DRAFT_7260208 [Phlegmacium glaucopus]|nr:hypothetical protein BYT27DRAFT_7260208 [Phlegmacium glaucopus]